MEKKEEGKYNLMNFAIVILDSVLVFRNPFTRPRSSMEQTTTAQKVCSSRWAPARELNEQREEKKIYKKPGVSTTIIEKVFFFVSKVRWPFLRVQQQLTLQQAVPQQLHMSMLCAKMIFA